MMQMDVPMLILKNALRYWWLLVLAGLLGALIGYGLHRLLPPVYQAQAAITVNIDYAQTGELTDVEEDHMIIAIGSLASSDEVVLQALAAADEAGLVIDRSVFDRNAALQRSFTRWLFIVRHQDPNSAALLANIWADAAWSVLTEAYQHAVRAHELEIYAESLSCCTVEQSAEDIFSCICNADELSEMQLELDEVIDDIAEEALASKGLAMGTLMAFNQRAQVPSKPVLLGRNLLVFAGGLIGMVASFVALFVVSSRAISRGDR